MRDIQHRSLRGAGGDTGGASRLNDNVSEQGARDLCLPRDLDPSSIQTHISAAKHK